MAPGSKAISDEDKDKLSDAEVKAASKNPPGDTEASGAAPGVKGADGELSDMTEVFDEPKSALKAREQASDAADEVRDQQWEVQRANWTNARAGHVETVFADRPEKGDPDTIVLAFVDQGIDMFVSGRSKPLRFSHENALALQRAVTKVAGSL